MSRHRLPQEEVVSFMGRSTALMMGTLRKALYDESAQPDCCTFAVTQPRPLWVT